MASVLDLVKHYQHSIEKYTKDEQKVLRCIDKLFNLKVTVQHLQETGVGRTVNALRKEPGEVGQASRALVSKWKLMVAAEESDQETDHTDTTIQNGYGNGKDSDDSSRQPNQNNENHIKKESSYSRHDKINGNDSGSKRKYHSSEEEEPDVKKPKNSDRNNHDDYKKSYRNNHDDHKKSNVKIEPRTETDNSHSESDEESDNSRSESESEMSESTVEDVKVKKEIKTEPTEHQKSSKHSSSRSEDLKKESSSKHSHDDKTSKSSKHSSSGSKEKHSGEKSSSKENSHSSHKGSKEKESSSEKKHKSDHKEKEKDKDKKYKEDSKSSKHNSSSSEKHKSSSHTDSGSDKHKNEKHSSKSEKHRSSSQSHKSEKDKHKSSSEKEISNEKHRSKDRSSSSSKEKHSSSSKDKSKEKSSSSKDKDNHKSEKKHSSSNEKTKSHDKSRDRVDDRSRTKSSSSHKSSKSSSSKAPEDIPKKKTQVNPGEDSDDGIGCESGASFAEALGMISPAKPKKKSVSLKDSSSPGNIDLSPAALLAPTAKLAPLPALEISALPEISPNYKPRPPPKLMPHFTDEEAMSHVISSKNQRTKVYSGNKVFGKIPTLYEMCVHILQEHIDALEYTGGVPYEILKPVIDKATPQQLFLLEHYNPYLMEDTDHLWQGFCEKHFRRQQRQEMETWREMYMRCQEEQEVKLRSLTENIKIAQEAKKAPIKQTKMAYVDSVVKPPRNIARKQALHGTAHAAAASPAARVASLAAAPNILRGSARPTPVPASAGSSSFKPKKAPLMAKALQFMRGRKR